MDTSQVEVDLEARIVVSKQWLESSPSAIPEIKFNRGTLWEALPVAFLDDPKRVERHGVRFRFSLLNNPRKIEVELDVRIHPVAEVKEKGDSWPYVIIYVIDQASGVGVEITHQDISPKYYEGLEELSIEDWYRKWIETALRHKKSSKIFRKEMILSD